MGAGVVRVHGTQKALAFTSDVTPRYVKANPFEGGKQAVAEAYRNLSAVGALPLATTDNLNFGNPEKPEIMGQLVGAIRGIGQACEALDMPIVSGNVSLYNETDGQAILPTPTIGAVGLIEDLDHLIAGRPGPGDVAVMIGAAAGHLGLQEAVSRDAPVKVAILHNGRSAATGGQLLPPRVLEKTMCRPSGAHDGSSFTPSLVSMRLAPSRIEYSE